MSRRTARSVLLPSTSLRGSHQRASRCPGLVGALSAAAMLSTAATGTGSAAPKRPAATVSEPKPSAKPAAPGPASKAESEPKAAGKSRPPAAVTPPEDTAPAQRKGPLPPEHGLHAGLEVKGSMLSDTLSFLVGPNIGWVVSDTWKVGVSGFLVANTVEPEQLQDAVGRRELELWYATGHVGYVLLAPYAIHLIPILAAGMGNVTVVRTDLGLGKYELVPLVEPAIEVELAPRPVPFFRAGVLASYRYMFTDDIDNVSASGFSNPAVGLFVRFGSF